MSFEGTVAVRSKEFNIYTFSDPSRLKGINLDILELACTKNDQHGKHLRET